MASNIYKKSSILNQFQIILHSEFTSIFFLYEQYNSKLSREAEFGTKKKKQ